MLRVDHPQIFAISSELEVASVAEREAYESSQQTNAFASMTTRQSCTATLRTKTNRYGRQGLLKGIELLMILGNYYRLLVFMSPFNTVTALHQSPRGPIRLSHQDLLGCVCVQGSNHSFGGAASCHDGESAPRYSPASRLKPPVSVHVPVSQCV